ncbi:MAG: hypothetical protein V1809_08050 [Planctomycetota bacterium]
MKTPLPLKRLVREVLAIPTAPFHEERVKAFIGAFAAERKIALTEDRAGNLLVTYRRGRARPVAFAAHMDHPGLEITAARGRRAEALWLGGGPRERLRGIRVRIFTPFGEVRGTIMSAAPVPEKRPGALRLTLATDAPVAPGDFGLWDLPAVRIRGNCIIGRALDDLGGCVAILALLDRLATRRIPARVIGIFTRAEEVGFVGASALIREKILPRRIPVISLETSRELPGARQGGGVILRVGDFAAVFTPDITQGLMRLARRLAAAAPAFRFQHRIMDGGTCEATPFRLAGYSAGGLCVALRNYHNQGPRGPAAETIRLDDLAGEIRFMEAIARHPEIFGEGRTAAVERVRHRFALYRRML